MILDLVTFISRIVGGVLLLLPTNLGTPAVITAPIAQGSPFCRRLRGGHQTVHNATQEDPLKGYDTKGIHQIVVSFWSIRIFKRIRCGNAREPHDCNYLLCSVSLTFAPLSAADHRRASRLTYKIMSQHTCILQPTPRP